MWWNDAGWPVRFPRRHGLENILLHIQHADARRTIQLVPGEDVEIAVQGLNVNRMVHHRLGTINQHFRTGLMGFVDDQRHRIFRPQHV